MEILNIACMISLLCCIVTLILGYKSKFSHKVKVINGKAGLLALCIYIVLTCMYGALILYDTVSTTFGGK